jgi:replicative DNA helicase
MTEETKPKTVVTPEQLAAFEALQDIDDHIGTTSAETTQPTPQFDWGEDYQRSLLAMLIADRTFLLESVDLVRYDYFTNKAHKKIAEILFEHFKEYRNIPSRSIFIKEMRDRFKDDDTKFFYLSELQLLYDSYEPGIDSREYHRKEIFNFAKMVALKKAFHKSMEELKKKPDENNTWTKIDKWLDEARVVDIRFDTGLDYFGSLLDRYVRMRAERENAEVFTTGFKDLDDELTSGGARRGEIYSFMGPPGVGKSLCLVKTAVENVKLNKKVLYISLEMSQDDIATRFDAQFADVNIKALIDNQDTIFSTLNTYTEDMDDKRLLLVKQFPSGTADVNTIRAYLQQLQMVGWEPDLLIVDYVGEMKDLPGVPLYESREKLVKDLRGLAVEYDICLFTAMQPNRAAREAMKDGGVISDDNLGDSYGQLRPLDGLYTINQTDVEKKACVARIYVAKQRAGKSRFTFFVSVSPLTLRFDSISEARYRVYMSKETEKAADEVKMDDILERKVTRFKPPEEEERG